MAAKNMSSELRVQQLRLLDALDVLAEEIAAVANSLPMSQASDFVDRELSNFAVQMRQHECGATTLVGSLGFAIDVCLRAKISQRLAEPEW